LPFIFYALTYRATDNHSTKRNLEVVVTAFEHSLSRIAGSVVRIETDKRQVFVVGKGNALNIILIEIDAS
jgi:hypothetical protein